MTNTQISSVPNDFKNGFKRIFHREHYIFFQENQIGNLKFEVNLKILRSALRLLLKSIARLILYITAVYIP